MLLESIREPLHRRCPTRFPRRLTTSIGIAFFDRPGLVGSDVMINADLTMFEAKEAGGDRYAVYSSV